MRNGLVSESFSYFRRLDVAEQVKKDEATLTTRSEIVSHQDDDYEPDLAVGTFQEGDDIDDDDVKYDASGNIIYASRSRGSKSAIELLPSIDHSRIEYQKFQKDIYRQHPENIKLTDDIVQQYLEDLEISITGENVPRPIQRFEHAGFDFQLVREISRLGFTNPTAIQAQALPIILSGRNLIGLAKTGSGKTFAYIWPMLMHVLAQTPQTYGDGPIGLVLAPTRELVLQIHQEAKKFSHLYDITLCPIFGGAGKWEMTKALKETPQIVIATPGRLIELIKLKATDLMRCSMIVLDEADRMFDLGFEPQASCILKNVRGDAQIVLFSATMKRKIEDFIRTSIEYRGSTWAQKNSVPVQDIIRIVVGKIGQANPDIQQIALILRSVDEKWTWLASQIDDFVASGKVLVFVSGKLDTEELSRKLSTYFIGRQLDIKVAYLHGDMDQNERSSIIKKFSKSSSNISDDVAILVATDVASRGLDIKNVHTVINYDVPKNIDSYVHRIGRTGRMGVDGVKPGTAYTLCTRSDSSFSVDLVKNLRLSGQLVSPELQTLAESDPKYNRINRGGATASSGLGGQYGKRAMTSEMMANESKPSADRSHLQFSRLLGSNPVHPQPLQSGNSPAIGVKKGRFSSYANSDSSYSQGTNVKGFVRGATTLSSVSQDARPPTAGTATDQIVTKKRSRWDT